MSQNQERRTFTRVHFDAPASIKTKNEEFKTTIADISLKGVLLKTDHAEKFAPEQTVRLIIALTDVLHLNMKLKIAHINNDLIGALISNIDLESMTHLRQIIELNLGDSDVLHRELNDLLSHDDSPPLKLH